jgi:hypothetical protein
LIRCHVPIFIQTSCVNERKDRRRQSRTSDAYRYDTFLPLAQLPDFLRALATTHTSVQNRGITIVIVNDIRHEKVLWACVQWRLSGIVLLIAKMIQKRTPNGGYDITSRPAARAHTGLVIVPRCPMSTTKS